MTIKISELAALDVFYANTIMPVVGSVLGTLTTLRANGAVLKTYITSDLTANAAVQAGQIATLTSNAATQAGQIATLTSNAATQSAAIEGVADDLVAANLAMQGYVDTGLSSITDIISTVNLANTIVARDASGNFAANTITGNLIGNVLGNVTGTLTGNATNVNGVVDITNGGTGGASQAQALTNLLPTGTVSGYVLKTSGPGSYYWGAETGATTQSGTRIESTRQFFTATAGQTLFTGVGTYTPGANQLRVYIDGVRQYNSAYTETSNTSFTLDESVVSGTSVMAEVDGYTDYNLTASDIDFSPVSTLESTNVQNAIAELLNELSPYIVPTGGIIIWSGAQAAIPSGWVLCDGSNSTPDLRDRFVIGAGSSYTVGNIGGSKDAVVVSHTHSITDPGHTHVQQNNGPDVDTGSLATGTQSSGTQYGSQSTVQSSVSTVSATTGISVNTAGESGVNKNLPPYYALCYIMKL